MTLLIPLTFVATLLGTTQWSLAWWTAALPAAVGVATLVVAHRPRHVVLGIAAVVAALAVLRADAMTASPSALTRLVSEREVTALRGEVVDDPSPRDRAQLVRLRVNAARAAEGEWHVVDGLAQVTTRLTPPIHYQDFIEVRGRIQPPDAGATPGYAAYLKRQGIEAIATFPTIDHRGGRGARGARGGTGLVRALSPYSGVSGVWVEDALIRLRGALAATLERYLPEPHAALAQGILLGRRATIPSDLTERLRTSGLTHVTAVSGYNVSLAVGFAAALGRLASARRRWHRLGTSALASAALWLFVALVGGSGSVLRAAAMAQLSLVGAATGRAGTAGGMLLWGSAFLAAASPVVVSDVGWQLSFLGTAGLVWLAPPLESLLGRLPRFIRTSLACTLAAQVFVLPVLVGAFGSLALVAPLSNVLALPLVPWIMLGTFLTGIAGLAAGTAAPLFAALTWVPLSGLLWIVEWTATLPWASVTLPPLGAGGGVAYLAALVALCAWLEARAQALLLDGAAMARAAAAHGAGAAPTIEMPATRSPSVRPSAPPAPLQQRAGVAVVGALAALVCVGFAMVQPPDGSSAAGSLTLEIPSLDEGSLVLLQDPNGTRALVGGGPAAGSAVTLLGAYLRPWDRTVDAVIAPDPREQHLTGLARVLERYRVGLLIDAVDSYPSSAHDYLRETARRRAVQTHHAERGEAISLGPPGAAPVLTLTPLSDPATFPLALRLEWGTFSALVPGDASPAQLRALLAGDHDLRATLLILPERTRRYAETARLLRAADPELVVVQGEPASGAAPDGSDSDRPVAWHHTSSGGPLKLRVRPDGTFARESR